LNALLNTCTTIQHRINHQRANMTVQCATTTTIN
jgi:hypothetical protein